MREETSLLESHRKIFFRIDYKIADKNALVTIILGASLELYGTQISLPILIKPDTSKGAIYI